jgi:hypothetical protein
MGRYYDVEGVRLLLHQSGSGGPAVVFLAGGGAVGLDYLNVQQRAGGTHHERDLWPGWNWVERLCGFATRIRGDHR